MIFYIIIPAHNEAAHIERTLQSFVTQTTRPTRLLVVNDASTDSTQKIIDRFSEKYSFIESIQLDSEAKHAPGSKVVEAFYHGYNTLDSNFDLIGKFDADIVLPNRYFEEVLKLFTSNEAIGIAGGNLYVQKGANWEYENISEKTKVRGPIKLYRKQCFKAIGGLKRAIGWDTVDGLLASYHGWQIATLESLHVKHLKPTGSAYTKASKYKQGEAFYRMRYGFSLAFIASAKLGLQKRSCSYFRYCMQGFFMAGKQNTTYSVSSEEGRFIRKIRWKAIKNKLFLKDITSS